MSLFRVLMVVFRTRCSGTGAVESRAWEADTRYRLVAHWCETSIILRHVGRHRISREKGHNIGDGGLPTRETTSDTQGRPSDGTGATPRAKPRPVRSEVTARREWIQAAPGTEKRIPEKASASGAERFPAWLPMRAGARHQRAPRRPGTWDDGARLSLEACRAHCDEPLLRLALYCTRKMILWDGETRAWCVGCAVLPRLVPGLLGGEGRRGGRGIPSCLGRE